jgi:hypothetical protein
VKRGPVRPACALKAAARSNRVQRGFVCNACSPSDVSRQMLSLTWSSAAAACNLLHYGAFSVRFPVCAATSLRCSTAPPLLCSTTCLPVQPHWSLIVSYIGTVSRQAAHPSSVSTSTDSCCTANSAPATPASDAALLDLSQCRHLRGLYSTVANWHESCEQASLVVAQSLCRTSQQQHTQVVHILHYALPAQTRTTSPTDVCIKQ